MFETPWKDFDSANVQATLFTIVCQTKVQYYEHQNFVSTILSHIARTNDFKVF